MNLLIIDDEIEILEIIKEQIEFLNSDIIIRTACTVELAIRLSDWCNIIISDVKMPNSNQLESFLLDCNKPFGRITGHADITSDLVLHKPFSNKGLIKLLAILIEKCK